MNDKIKEILEKHLPYINECLPDEALIALNNAIIEICEEQKIECKLHARIAHINNRTIINRKDIHVMPNKEAIVVSSGSIINSKNIAK